jgi:hypothetical protein
VPADSGESAALRYEIEIGTAELGLRVFREHLFVLPEKSSTEALQMQPSLFAEDRPIIMATTVGNDFVVSGFGAADFFGGVEISSAGGLVAGGGVPATFNGLATLAANVAATGGGNCDFYSGAVIISLAGGFGNRRRYTVCVQRTR